MDLAGVLATFTLLNYTTASNSYSVTYSITMADKLRNQQELERLQAKYVGTGHPDTTSWEWRTNIQRDTYSSIAGHRPLVSYIALAENEPVIKVRAQMIRKMIQPCGAPPPRET
ncbi:splicing factor 3B subunit 10-domain-containing protein [Ilyonectria robusta]|uniref:splicing factor 3B subunit 10-domain-containing protein n=1 Tax=Ilyonectria robusta TaxID=1079257 RepID=UPI001E8E8561|nr:splicing factor 3B subunit 10-domain-containing protein [Ilyonectria robusta]KAH8676929.1 splicing factor 3B subunit 10-domain-containing protein [Ilyonectria robusta]